MIGRDTAVDGSERIMRLLVSYMMEDPAPSAPDWKRRFSPRRLNAGRSRQNISEYVIHIVHGGRTGTRTRGLLAFQFAAQRQSLRLGVGSGRIRRVSTTAVAHPAPGCRSPVNAPWRSASS